MGDGGGDISDGQPPTGVKLTPVMLPHSLSAGVCNALPSYGDKETR